MDRICSKPELRQNLEIAQFLAKSDIGFVVMPVADRAEFVRLTQILAQRLDALAVAVEKGGA